MKGLVEGRKYIIYFKDWTSEQCYFDGIVDTIGQRCDCCGRQTEQAYNFKVPSDSATYEEVISGNFADQINIGKTCIKKIDIESVG